MKTHRFERGQALVLIVLAIIAMFGFAALAVDFGRVYAERRRVQSAADAAALAAGFAASQSQPYQQKALDQLAANDIFDTDPGRNEDLRVDVELNNPPASGPYGPGSSLTLEQRERYYQVIIHSQVDQIFSQFIYGGPLKLTVEAVSYIQSSHGVYSGRSLVATNPSFCKAMWVGGTGDITIEGGDVLSISSAGRDGESCTEGVANGPGGADCASGVQGGSGSVTIEGGSIDTTGPWLTNGGAGAINVDSINQCQDAPEIETPPKPDCTPTVDFPNRTYEGGEAIGANSLQPGVYDDIIVHGSGTQVHMDPGMYCLNGNFSINGGEITGKGVFIYMAGGSVDIGGNTSVNLEASTDLEDAAHHQWAAMLIYMPYENTGTIHLSGGSDSTYSGTIMATGPITEDDRIKGNYKCQIEGNVGSISYNSNIVCNTVKLTGGADLSIYYDAARTYHTPPSIDLVQ